MPGQGGGPSRRSHTKSRKGCKTCKRRHIRCDETFPQCRNCTKHQVRCDYLDDAAQHQESHASSSVNSPSVPLSSLPWTPEIEAIVDRWQQNGEASLGDLVIDLNTPGHTYTRSDMHLMYFMLLSGQSAETAQYTVWNATNVHAFAAAKYRPFLVHAMLALSALSLAWEYDSVDVKSLAYHHGAIALQGLQEAIANYSEDNGDAILLASLLLSWQANDWRSWVSLTSGIRTLVNNMRPYKSRSMIPHIIDEQILAISESFPSQSSLIPPEEYRSTLRQVYGALETLQPYITGRREAVWIDQIKDYVDRLLSAQAPVTSDEQFNYLYVFRKYLFWVPSMSLKTQTKDMMTLIVLAHLYSTALQLEPLFPDVAPAFCTRLAARPLEEILDTFTAMREQDASHGQQMATMSYLLSHPQSVMAQHHARVTASFSLPQIHSTPPPQSDSNIVTTDLVYSIEAFGIPGQRSPAFGPPPTHQRGSTDMSPSYGSPYLEVPRANSTVWSPTATLRSSHGSELGHEPYMGGSETGYDVSGGFVAPQLLWT